MQLLLEAHADEEGPTDAEADSILKPTQLDKKTLTDSEIVGVSIELSLLVSREQIASPTGVVV